MRRRCTAVCCIWYVDFVYCYALLMWFALREWMIGWQHSHSEVKVTLNPFLEYTALSYSHISKIISCNWEIIKRKYYNSLLWTIVFSGKISMNYIQGIKETPRLCGRRTALNDGCISTLLKVHNEYKQITILRLGNTSYTNLRALV
jgi:hypothetical protein